MNMYAFASFGLALLGVVACDGTESSSSAGAPVVLDTGLPPEKLLSALTTDELAQLNQALATATTQAQASLPKGQQCLYKGVSAAYNRNANTDFYGVPTDASLQQSCTDSVALCERSAAPAMGATQFAVEQIADCSATVSELETCLSDATSANLAFTRALPACSTLTVANIASTKPSSETPASCALVVEKCPSISSNGTTTTS